MQGHLFTLLFVFLSKIMGLTVIKGPYLHPCDRMSMLNIAFYMSLRK